MWEVCVTSASPSADSGMKSTSPHSAGAQKAPQTETATTAARLRIRASHRLGRVLTSPGLMTLIGLWSSDIALTNARKAVPVA